MSRAIAVTCQAVSKSFALVDGGTAWRLLIPSLFKMPAFHALKDISFDVPKGQFVGILGRNGAGKSTLLRVVGGVYPCDRGRVSISGALSGLYELGLVGHPELTGRSYSERLLTVQGFSSDERTDMVRDIHDFSELEDRFDDPVFTYSSGMGARLFFATATAGCYDVYLLDEILSVGDRHFQMKCWRRLRDRVSDGASGILVTQDWSAIVKLCETAHVLDKGKIIFTGPAQRAARHYLYGESEQETHRGGIAQFIGRPRFPSRLQPGRDFVMVADARIKANAEVGVVFVIERLQPGFGWETALMSRAATPVGKEPGLYEVEVRVPELPLQPGSYQISIHLVMSDSEKPSQRILLDGFSWLNGTGLPFEVSGTPGQGLTLSTSWSVVNS